jgi:hypothetical protein
VEAVIPGRAFARTRNHPNRDWISGLARANARTGMTKVDMGRLTRPGLRP